MIKLNSNLYSILFLGDIENFKNSLERRRLNLFYQNELLLGSQILNLLMKKVSGNTKINLLR